MPLFDFICLDCKVESEILVLSSTEQISCPSCSGTNLKKLLSPHSSLSGSTSSHLPGSGDTACCGSTPMEAGCAGPGSCCGKSG